MRFVDILISSFLLFLPSVWAALPSDANNGMLFFRDKNSLFPSGQASRQALVQKIMAQETEDSYQIRLNGKDYLVNSDNLVRDIHLARFVTNPAVLNLKTAPTPHSPIKGQVAANSIVEILQIKSQYAQVQTAKKLQGWVRLSQLTTRHDDTGVLLSTETLKVYSRADEKSIVVGELHPLSRVNPIEISEKFVKFVFNTQTAYARIEKFLSRSDLAVLVYHSKSKWKYIKERSQGHILTSDRQTIPLEDLKGFVSDTSKAIYLRSPNRQNLPIINQVQIVQKISSIWNMSEISGHGKVWWKETPEKTLLLGKNIARTITTDELVDRKIFSIAFSDKNPNIGLASANGLFHTNDGLNWKRVESFKDENLPVAIHPKGAWFAGHYRSNDSGKTFEPFIRWDKLAKTIQLNTDKNPQQIKITNIQPLANSRIQIEVDTGYRKLKFKSLIGDLQWEIVRN